MSGSPQHEDIHGFLQDFVNFDITPSPSSSLGSSSSSVICTEEYPQKILCVGLCRTDIVQVCREFPKEYSELECVECRWQRGGNASNTCTVLSQFEVPVEFLGTLSDEEPRLEKLMKDMNEHNIDYSHCPIKHNTSCPTTSILINSQNFSRTMWNFNPDLPELTIQDFKGLNLNDYSWIHFEGRNVDNVIDMMEAIHNHNVRLKSKYTNITHGPIVISIELDSKRPGIFKLVPYADVVFIGERFISSVGDKNMTHTLDYVNQIQKKPGVIIICAWDDRGALGRAPNGERTQCPAQLSLPIVDIFGASDTFNASVIYYLNLENISIRRGGEDLDLSTKCALAKIHSVSFQPSGQYDELISPLEFIDPEVLYQALVFACRTSGAKVGFKGFSQLKGLYEELSVHKDIKL